MPCNDISEFIVLHIDHQDRLQSYTLHKKSCGKSVGPPALLLPCCKEKTIEYLLQLDADELLDAMSPKNDKESFLFLKHLFALQLVLQTFLGRDTQDTEQACTIIEVVHENGAFTVKAYIAIEVVLEKIQACAHCTRCHAS